MTKVRYVCKCECGLQLTCLPHAYYACVDMYAKYVCSFVVRECLSHRVKINFNFTLPLDKTTECLPHPPASLSTVPSCTQRHCPRLSLQATLRERRQKNECLRVAMRLPGASPDILLPPQPPAPFTLCCSTLPAPLGTLENVTKILY